MNLAALVLLLLAFYLFLIWFERANVWIPSRTLTTTPDNAGLTYEDQWLTAADGVRFHAWYVPHPEAVAALVFCHGNGGNLSNRVPSLRQFHDMGLSVLVFDYRGYGQSGGSLSEEGTYLDGVAAAEWMRTREPDLPLVMLGRSLGSAIATEVALRVPVDGLIFESGFTSVNDLGAERFPFLPVRWLSRIGYDSGSKIASIECPVLVIHGDQDRIVPYHHGETIFARAREPKTFLRLAGFHNDAFYADGDTYEAGISAFLNEYILTKETP